MIFIKDVADLVVIFCTPVKMELNPLQLFYSNIRKTENLHLEVNKLIMSNTFLSTKSDEDEVLILPYSAFKIKNKEVIFDSKHQGKRIEFQFEEWDETSSNTNSLPTIYSFFLYNFNNLIFFLINLT